LPIRRSSLTSARNSASIPCRRRRRRTTEDAAPIRCSGKACLPRQGKAITRWQRTRVADARSRDGGMPPRWQECPEALARTCNDRGRPLGGGLVALHRHADFARWTVCAAGPGFPKADKAAPKLNHRLRHHRSAALRASHRPVSFCPCTKRYHDTDRTQQEQRQPVIKRSCRV
jgi:hypothetical protein